MENITAREFFLTTFKHDFLTDEEKETIISAIELYSNGVKKQEILRAEKLVNALQKIKDSCPDGSWFEKTCTSAIKKYNPLSSLLNK